MSKFLDNTGLSYFWSKVKTALAGKADKADTVLETTLSRGRQSTAGTASIAFGNLCIASASYSQAVGNGVTASGNSAHAEGAYTTASGSYSHAEGSNNTAYGFASHVEGEYNEARGIRTHAEGEHTKASGSGSHSEGHYTIANSAYQHVAGEYNVADSSTASLSRGTYIEIIGNGTADNARSNARTLDWSGNAEFAGDVTANGCGGTSPITMSGLYNAVNATVPITRGGTGAISAVAARRNLNETYTAGTYTLSGKILNGFITNASRSVYLQLISPLSLYGITNVTINDLSIAIRTVSGNYLAGNSSSNNWVTMSGMTVSAVRTDYHEIRITIVAQSALTNATNNTPIVGYGDVTFTLS